MSIKLAILPRTRAGLNREGLQAYLAHSHGPLVMAHGEVSGMFAGYVHHYVHDEPSTLGETLADRDALTIIRFARIEDMIASKASPAYAQIVGPDEDNFRDPVGSLAMLVSETTVLAGPENVARKLFIFRHGADAQDAQGWAEALAPILIAQGVDGPIAAWRINTIARTLEGPAPAELFDEVSLRGAIPADLADALSAAAQTYFADAPASLLITSPRIFVSSQKD
ncbi:EthD domain-containing protein [Novosphingobium humi]|uniref:EthD domain-containing protein n=1 Tax=Novosphingobium humi TaxID=2282397 RepID=A0ABY7TUZ8_9SPHN|nr:EthD domain-containing protein [Novosphingobium humi]WCT76838.1 EthD domain-containing protein [Novosphingobium humi]